MSPSRIPSVGVFLPTLGDARAPIADVVAAAIHAESLGLESVWVVDQLVAGTGDAILESTLVLAAAAAVTDRVGLGLGVLIVPLRAPAWIAKAVATLQHLGDDRVILGVGIGGDRHARSWDAAGVPRRERGRRLDDALRVLPGLIAGKEEDGIRLTPGATVPPIIVGGGSDAAVRRAEAHDGWFLLPAPPEGVREAAGRVSVPVTANLTLAVTGDTELPGRDEVVRMLVDPGGRYALPAEVAEEFLFYGDAAAVRSRLEAYGAAGADRVVVTFVAGSWTRQVELLASVLTPTVPSGTRSG